MQKPFVFHLETGAIAVTWKLLEQLGELFDGPVSSVFGKATISLFEKAEAIAKMAYHLSKEDRQLML